MKPCGVLSELNYKGNITFNDYIKECKRIFKQYIYDKKFKLMGYDVRLVHNKKFDKCFNKLMKGGPLYHNKSDKYDKDRLKKIMWIHDILQNYSLCDNENKCRGIIISMLQHENKKNVVLYCETYNYALFFLDYTHRKRPFYMLVTAFSHITEKKKQEIIKNKIL